MLATLSIYVFRIEEERHFKLADVGHAESMHQILTRLYHKIIHTLFSVLQRRQLAFLYIPPLIIRHFKPQRVLHMHLLNKTSVHVSPKHKALKNVIWWKMP